MFPLAWFESLVHILTTQNTAQCNPTLERTLQLVGVCWMSVNPSAKVSCWQDSKGHLYNCPFVGRLVLVTRMGQCASERVFFSSLFKCFVVFPFYRCLRNDTVKTVDFSPPLKYLFFFISFFFILRESERKNETDREMKRNRSRSLGLLSFRNRTVSIQPW